MGTILVIDDDPAFLRETERMLGEAGHQVLQATDGIRAVHLLEQLHGCVDLAIVDLALPGINGFELIGALSRRPNSVKVIATSGVFGDLQLESATAVGAHAAIRKPANAKDLPRLQWLSTVQQLIGNG
jgi:CheY-like chemotaxis protein